ncbi:jg23270 [Pararge aegeria aegeria]|uniref:Jg23270 protein n=1 Tax=Pararge aegeria aegeria TaxID=348720 RepID=A0A8S4RM18_9NEOP|nr:jg23270 [Pararge aegeria aegeria]
MGSAVLRVKENIVRKPAYSRVHHNGLKGGKSPSIGTEPASWSQRVFNPFQHAQQHALPTFLSYVLKISLASAVKGTITRNLHARVLHNVLWSCADWSPPNRTGPA